LITKFPKEFTSYDPRQLGFLTIAIAIRIHISTEMWMNIASKSTIRKIVQLQDDLYQKMGFIDAEDDV